MKKTKVIRVDGEFGNMLNEGARILQASTGKRVSTIKYTSELACMMRPFIGLTQEAVEARGKRKSRG